MSILKKMKKSYYRTNRYQWDEIKKQKEIQYDLIFWTDLKTYLKLNPKK